MTYIWFQSVLAALNKRVNFESISNLYGNSFAKDAGKAIAAANPFVKNGGKINTGVMGLIGQIKVIDSTKNAEATKQAEKQIFGDTSWAEGLM